MAEVETASQLITWMPALEPLAGASLAINLAYLNLNRFRYRSEVRKHAESTLNKLEAEASDRIAGSETATTSLYHRLKWLAEKLPDKELADGVVPAGFSSWAYRWLFKHNQDCVISIALAAYAGICLILGVASSIHYLVPDSIFTAGSFSLIASFWILLIGLLTPVFLVLAGRMSKNWGVKMANQSSSDLTKTLRDAAKNAPRPGGLGRPRPRPRA